MIDMRRIMVAIAAITLFASLFFIFTAVDVKANSKEIVPTQSHVETEYSQADPDVVLLATSMGNISIELFADMPITSGNFKNLTEHGIYDGTTFNRVAHDFVIQGGDTTSKGIVVPPIPDELPNKHSNIRGSVGMAKTSEPNSATSQFYINLANNTFLDSGYTVFGQVIAGMNVVDNIGNVPTNPANDGAPLTTITINTARLIPEYSQAFILIFLGSTLLAIALARKKIARTHANLKTPL